VIRTVAAPPSVHSTGAMLSAPLMSPQDAGGPDEVCFGSRGRFDCWRTAPDLAGTERLAWSAKAPDFRAYLNQAVSIGDLDGDGLPELATGNTDGQIEVFGAAAKDHLLLSIGYPPIVHAQTGFYVARVAPLPAGDGVVRLVGATTGGWVHGWRVAADGAAWEWSFQTKNPILPTPRWVRIVRNDGERRWCVLVATGDACLYLLEPPADDSRQPRIVWSYNELSAGTPEIVEDGDRPWAVFATAYGRVVKIPIGPRPETSAGAERKEPGPDSGP